MSEAIVYHKFDQASEHAMSLPRNPKPEIFTQPMKNGTKLHFDVTAMNEYWNGLDVDYNAFTPLTMESAQEFYDDGFIDEARVSRFADTIHAHRVLGLRLQQRPLFAVNTDEGIRVIDGRHTYMAWAMLHMENLQAGVEIDVHTYVFLEDEWKQFLIDADVPDAVPFTTPRKQVKANKQRKAKKNKATVH